MKTINVKSGALEPEAAVRAAVEHGETELEVLLDDPISASAVMRFLEHKGYGVHLQDDEGTVTLSARKGGGPSLGERLSGEHLSGEYLLSKPRLGKPMPEKSQHPVYAAQPTARPNITAPRQTSAAPAKTFFVLVTRSALGSDAELGETLMKNFLSALAQAELPPLAVALVNEGVKLARYDSSSCDHLKALERKGVSILVCGTCVNYFSIMDEIGVGSICGMPEIVETIGKAGKVVTL